VSAALSHTETPIPSARERHLAAAQAERDAADAAARRLDALRIELRVAESCGQTVRASRLRASIALWVRNAADHLRLADEHEQLANPDTETTR
jgi:hypothetical protein